MSRRLITFLVVFCTFTAAFAQKQTLKNIPYIDQRRFHYGFSLGASMADATFIHNDNPWFAECTGFNPAFCVGLMGDMAITENFSLRCEPMLLFFSRDVHFVNYQTHDTQTQDLKNCYLQLPISMKISTKRLNNYRPYIMAGADVQYDLSRDKESPIVFRPLDVGLHIAIGCDTYLPYFKLCPELRFNLGLLDMLDHERKGLKDLSLMQYTDAISRARNKSISLIFFFE